MDPASGSSRRPSLVEACEDIENPNISPPLAVATSLIISRRFVVMVMAMN
jgi:hypothetical protein